MEAPTFDRLTRTLSRRLTRRTLPAWAAGLAAAMTGAATGRASAAGDVPLGGMCAAAADCAPATFIGPGTGVETPRCAAIGIAGDPHLRCCIAQGGACRFDDDCCGSNLCQPEAGMEGFACGPKRLSVRGPGERCGAGGCSGGVGVAPVTCGRLGREARCCHAPGVTCGLLPGSGSRCCDGAVCAVRDDDGALRCREIPAGIPLEAALPAMRDLLGGYLRPDTMEGTYRLPTPVRPDLERIAASSGDPDATANLFRSLGWEGNAAFGAYSEIGAAMYFSVHRFGSTPEAAAAFDHLAGDILAPAPDTIRGVRRPDDPGSCASALPADAEGTWLVVHRAGVSGTPAAADPGRPPWPEVTLVAQRGPFVAVASEISSGPGTECERTEFVDRLVVATFSAFGLLGQPPVPS